MPNNGFNESAVMKIVADALREDVGFGDITSESLIPEEQRGRGIMLAKQRGVVSGMEILPIVFGLTDGSITVTPALSDGAIVEPGNTLAEISGPVRGLLTGERVALNFLQRLSGIATLTRQFVELISDTTAKITDTRKTTPTLRALEKKAVRDGGGVNHRFGLDQMVLIKDNHIAAAGSVTAAITRCRAYLQERRITVPIEIETTTLEQVDEVLRCGGVDRIMLDNYEIEKMTEAVRRIARAVEVEASGGVTLETVRPIAETGVDFISVGALTHSLRALDISFEILS